jgi:uncharacterized protein YlxW (UPF0749 family)
MYEKLDKLRAELKRAQKKKTEIEAKIKNLEQRLAEAESAQILADVKAMNLTPEQLAKFLQMAAGGQLPIPKREDVEIAVDDSTDQENLEVYDDEEELPF